MPYERGPLGVRNVPAEVDEDKTGGLGSAAFNFLLSAGASAAAFIGGTTIEGKNALLNGAAYIAEPVTQLALAGGVVAALGFAAISARHKLHNIGLAVMMGVAALMAPAGYLSSVSVQNKEALEARSVHVPADTAACANAQPGKTRVVLETRMGPQPYECPPAPATLARR